MRRRKRRRRRRREEYYNSTIFNIVLPVALNELALRHSTTILSSLWTTKAWQYAIHVVVRSPLYIFYCVCVVGMDIKDASLFFLLYLFNIINIVIFYYYHILYKTRCCFQYTIQSPISTTRSESARIRVEKTLYILSYSRRMLSAGLKIGAGL